MIWRIGALMCAVVIAGAGLSLCAGDRTITGTSKPMLPTKEGLSEVVREQVYAVQVISRQLARLCDQMAVLEWPSDDKLNTDAGLYSAMGDEDARRLQQWLRLCLDYSDPKKGLLLEKGKRLSYIGLNTPNGILRVRMYNNLLELNRWPTRIDVLCAKSLSNARLEAVVGDLAHTGLSQKSVLKDMPKVRDMLMELSWHSKCITLPWELRSFAVERECNLVKCELVVPDSEAPLDMTVWIGSEGIQVTLHGKGLQHMAEFIRDGRVGTGYNPSTDSIPPPMGKVGK